MCSKRRWEVNSVHKKFFLSGYHVAPNPTAYRNVTEFKTLRGLVLRGSPTERHLFVYRVDFPPLGR